MASLCMAVSAFVIMLIFIAGNAAQKLLMSYFYSSSPQLFSVTCRIEGDAKYQLTEYEIEALAAKYSDIADAYYYASPPGPCRVCSTDVSLLVSGMSRMPDNLNVCAGEDLFYNNDICGHGIMLSEKTAEEIYTVPSSAVGRIVMITSPAGITREYRVTGIYRSSEGSDSVKAVVSLPSYSDLFAVAENLRFSHVQFRLSDIERSEYVASCIKKALVSRCMEDQNYKVRIADLDLTRNIRSVIRTVTFVLLAASVIIIIVSGIGIRNVIISIMQSYAHIIGIERAVGASDRVIAAEYLLQGGVIAFSGTFLGCTSALLLMASANRNITLILEYLAEKFSLEYLSTVSFKLNITAAEIMITVVLSVVTVMICCYDPVRKAASMRVVDSLRQ